MVLFLFGCATLVQLFRIQVLYHDVYAEKAQGQQSFERTIPASRGGIFWTDLYSSGALFPVAIDKASFEVFIVPKDIHEKENAARVLADTLDLPYEAVKQKADLKNDPYEPIQKKVTEEKKLEIESHNLEGIGFKQEAQRFYPEESLVSHITGFVGFDGDRLVGRYGLEEYFENELVGKNGILATERDVHDRPIGVGERRVENAQNGMNVVLTLDKTLQFVVCKKLDEYILKYHAEAGTVIILEPFSGAVRAMCNAPRFNPNAYSEARDAHIFVNSAISKQYEPGSIFKSITMAAGLDAGAVTPYVTYVDKGVEKIGGYTIRNAARKVYGESSMIEVLDYSINTGAIFVMRKTGKDVFARYLKEFGFGELSGITLSGEAMGDIALLDQSSEVYFATASFGQGIAVTPLQMVIAYAAIANGGELVQPYVVKEMQYYDGSSKIFDRKVVRRVISQGAASTLTAMLTSVVQNGHAKKAGVKGYLIAGKTGTAQVPNTAKAGYSDDTIHSFIGFGPADDPAFVILVKLDKPRASGIRFAEETAAPLFREIASFLLNYLEIPPRVPS
ncbi:MAG: Peptidoglycan glycosyltransferase [Parcubacteria group bacterium GW2011_GWA2_44_12]|nr:MAG: Peptidoglycan glycosyltransferase [Parcubacteria group bacterium GW2011_GWA2_44_12]